MWQCVTVSATSEGGQQFFRSLFGGVGADSVSLRRRFSDMTSYFQDGGHDVIPRKAFNWLAVCATVPHP